MPSGCDGFLFLFNWKGKNCSLGQRNRISKAEGQESRVAGAVAMGALTRRGFLGEPDDVDN